MPFFVAEFSRQASAEDAAAAARLIRKDRLAVGSDVYSFTVLAQTKEEGDGWKAFSVINREGETLVWRENVGVDLNTMGT